MSISEKTQNKSTSLWKAVVTHPFVLEMGQSTLPKKKFQQYFGQDYLFIKEEECPR